jgi:hypothetical protein
MALATLRHSYEADQPSGPPQDEERACNGCDTRDAVEGGQEYGQEPALKTIRHISLRWLPGPLPPSHARI